MHHHFASRVNRWPMEANGESFDAVWFEMLFRIIAQLHEHIGDGSTGALPALSSRERVERLEAIIYTAHEIITPLDVRYPEREADDTRRHGLS